VLFEEGIGGGAGGCGFDFLVVSIAEAMFPGVRVECEGGEA
jgi:hypothetical protein